MYMYSFMGLRFNCELFSDGLEVMFKYCGMNIDYVLVVDIKNNWICWKCKIKIFVENYNCWIKKVLFKIKKKMLYNSNYGLIILF